MLDSNQRKKTSVKRVKQPDTPLHPMPYKLGTPYGNRTHLYNVKGCCPKPIDEPSINMKAILTGNSITVRQQDGRLTYPDVQTNMLINLLLLLITI